jgi:hypothetical protein
MVENAINCAACPDETARAAAPPSRAATLFSKTSEDLLSGIDIA